MAYVSYVLSIMATDDKKLVCEGLISVVLGGTFQLSTELSLNGMSPADQYTWNGPVTPNDYALIVSQLDGVPGVDHEVMSRTTDDDPPVVENPNTPQNWWASKGLQLVVPESPI